jgi:multimeric flavodoxin WrbA
LSRVLVILGSAREDSNTLKAVKEFCPFDSYEILDLKSVKLNPYNYNHSLNNQDDFQKIIEKMNQADHIIFATPVYWYSMSGLMKTLFDRFTELLSTYKQVGKSLKGKKTYLISVGSDQELPDGFEVPFKLTSEYFGMNYQRSFYKELT